jgi:hypothetical protein
MGLAAGIPNECQVEVEPATGPSPSMAVHEAPGGIEGYTATVLLSPAVESAGEGLGPAVVRRQSSDERSGWPGDTQAGLAVDFLS